MRRFNIKAALAVALLCLTVTGLVGCGSDDEPAVEPTETAATAVAKVLNGHFLGSKTGLSESLTEYEDIVFSPLSKPEKRALDVIEVSGLTRKDVTVYGSASVSKYVGDHLMTVSHTCLYEINASGTELTFYAYDPETGRSTGNVDRRIIKVLSASQFLMRSYGLTEENNLAYTKQ